MNTDRIVHTRNWMEGRYRFNTNVKGIANSSKKNKVISLSTVPVLILAILLLRDQQNQMSKTTSPNKLRNTGMMVTTAIEIR